MKVKRAQYVHMDAYLFDCPGCGRTHMFVVGYEETYRKRLSELSLGTPTWLFNGSLEKPTFGPSLLNRWNFGEKQVPKVCHLYVRDGRIQFLNDCTHDLKGQTVEMEECEV